MLFDSYSGNTLVVIDSELWVCGIGNHGKLGLNDNLDRTTFTKVDNKFDGSGIKSVGCSYSLNIVLTNNGNVYISGSHPNIKVDGNKSDIFVQIDYLKNIEEIYSSKTQSSCFVAKKSNKLYLCNRSINKIYVDCNYIHKVCFNNKLYIILTDRGLYSYNSENKTLINIEFDKYNMIEDIVCTFLYSSYAIQQILLLVNEDGVYKIYLYQLHNRTVKPIDGFTFMNPKFSYGSEIYIFEKNTKEYFRIDYDANIHKRYYPTPNIEICDMITNHSITFFITRDKIYYSGNYCIESGLSKDGSFDNYRIYEHEFLSNMPLDIFKKYKFVRTKNAKK